MESNSPRQGDYLANVRELWSRGSDGTAVRYETPNGVVLISQCCDMARPKRGDVPVAAAVVILDGPAASNARSGRQPRYARVAQLSEEYFVDFGVTGSIEHDGLSGRRIPIASTDDRMLLASRIARRFSRFAYPDEVQPYVRRLQDRIRAKVGAAMSPLGQCLERVQAIRIEADWDEGPPWALNIVFVLKEGELPTLDEEPTPIRGAVSVPAAAQRVAQLPSGSPDLFERWSQLAEALRDEANSDPDAAKCVSEASVEVLQESEFNYFRYRRSTDIDVDDLSDPEVS